MTFVSRTLAASFVLAILSLSATAQTPTSNTTEWENESLKLRLFYPSDLVKADPEKVLHDGHLALFNVEDPKLAAETHCLRPALLLELPQSGPAQTTDTEPTPDGGTHVTIKSAITASILLAELDIDCVNNEHESSSTTLLNDLAEIVNKVPGMKPIAQPAWYNVGWQKVHMAASQGQPQVPAQAAAQADSQPAVPAVPIPQSLYTMGLSTNWNSHLLVWYFSSNNIDTLNRITKTTVRFGRADAAPLYPVQMGTAAH
ncbi:hypothetical protein [Granulicella sp. S190]|uniref:hypothetical protein n=1 Tax=Granulicella sp. S190 TaxID=1747226 RepID=UPI00131D9238|nr:hypothetical protein [Granulicella sp. S190]